MSSTTPTFDATALDSSYAFLDDLPEKLYVPVVTSSAGTLAERVASILAWRKALLAGRLPDVSINWPANPMRDALLRELTDLQITRFCRDQPELADELLLDILQATDNFSRFIPQRQRELFEDLKRLEEERHKPKLTLLDVEFDAELIQDFLNNSESLSGWLQELKQLKAVIQESPEISSKYTMLPAPLVKSLRHHHEFVPELIEDIELLMRQRDRNRVIRKLHGEAARHAEEEGVGKGVAALRDNWAERTRVWSEIWDVFGDLGELLGRGRDLARGILRHHGWQEIVRLRKLLESCPQLVELVRTLGRLQERIDENTPSVMERVFVPVRRALDEWREVQTEFAPHEVHGLTLSDDISRMIPAEAATLGHPMLKYLWHARRIEHALLTYRVQGVMDERVTSESDVMTEIEQARPKPRLKRGPIIVCLDTSGSMHGEPEIVAKAIVLEAIRTAHLEKRPCYLYSFSGPHDVDEIELNLSQEGLSQFVDFLSKSFHGGTDIQEPLNRALKRTEEDSWKRANIVLVSDGEFSVPSQTVHFIETKRKDHDLKIHGILVGSRDTSSMRPICDHIHSFSDWKLM